MSITNSSTAVPLSMIEAQLVRQYNIDHPMAPGMTGGGSVYMSADEIRKAANNLPTQTADLTPQGQAERDALPDALNALANKLASGDRTLDANGDGLLQVKLSGTISPYGDHRSELEKYAGIADQFPTSADLSSTSLDANGNPVNQSGSTQNILTLLLNLLQGQFGGNESQGFGGNILLLLMVLLLSRGGNNTAQ